MSADLWSWGSPPGWGQGRRGWCPDWSPPTTGPDRSASWRHKPDLKHRHFSHWAIQALCWKYKHTRWLVIFIPSSTCKVTKNSLQWPGEVPSIEVNTNYAKSKMVSVILVIQWLNMFWPPVKALSALLLSRTAVSTYYLTILFPWDIMISFSLMRLL